MAAQQLGEAFCICLICFDVVYTALYFIICMFIHVLIIYIYICKCLFLCISIHLLGPKF